MKIVVTVNGPGEAAGWLRPLASAIARGGRDVSLMTVVTPSQLASGREPALVAKFAGVSRVARLGTYLRQATVARVTGASDDPARLVLHLGGDPLYALGLARLHGAAAWTYGTGARYRNAFQRFLVPDERTAHKLRSRAVAADRITVVGQLVTDSVRDGRQVRVGTGNVQPTVVYLPGSRDAYVGVMVPYFAAVAERTFAAGLRTRSVLLVSPFVIVDHVAAHFGQAGWSIARSNGTVEAASPLGATMRVVPGGLEDLEAADLVVTIPGTNTLQLAALGMPHVVVTPGHQAEQIAFEGLFGLLKPHWWGATTIRRAALHRISRRKPYLALPNIIAGEAVVPELRGAVEPADVAALMMSLLAAPDTRRDMSARLRAVAGAPGAADRIVELMLEFDGASCASAS